MSRECFGICIHWLTLEKNTLHGHALQNHHVVSHVLRGRQRLDPAGFFIGPRVCDDGLLGDPEEDSRYSQKSPGHSNAADALTTQADLECLVEHWRD